MSTRSRRPSISIYDYPEHLNPFNDDIASSQPPVYREGGKTPKESKHKFWTFGRSRKKRSHSFSIKSTWNGLFGKRKEAVEPAEKRSTITTVSTTYKREPCDRPIAPARLSKDQQEFDEALGTLARRRKYTLDNNASRYNSSLTVNGDPARIYDGSPQDTTTSIMGDLTPKPPARKFGQVSPRPTDKIPPLNFENKELKENGNVSSPSDKAEGTPIPPLRRFGNRSSQRLNGGTSDLDEEASRSGDVTLRDENENVPEDYVFKRFSQDAVRRSNLSINSCVSVTSTASTYGRKKRRAPQPPQRREQLETPQENDVRAVAEATNVQLQIVEPIDIARVTENLDELTKKNCEPQEDKPARENALREEEEQTELCPKITVSTSPDGIADSDDVADDVKEKDDSSGKKIVQSAADKAPEEVEPETKAEEKTNEPAAEEDLAEQRDDSVDVEYQRTSQEKIEIIKDTSEEEVCLRRGGSSGTLSRSDSFSVKEEIEKIEKQIKALESKNAWKEQEQAEDEALTSPRLSIQANRRHFFENMVSNGQQSGVKIEFKELPREQKDIHVVRLTDAPQPVAAPREPVKVIELHISEPIRQKPELLNEVNPIPKPRRHSALSLNDVSESRRSNENNGSPQEDKRGKSF
ncbi:protein bangles and beads [Harpegnathos saltator]|uniref:Uncharacterized protein n=1 Tax=Harpegnathos saltator TaxID=610380 RepID=E2BRE7_HARSA|nr:protein bangles and beads [Harpegnathos saltator]XP_011143793.1 protein bangles and beads [Harpegnathos saltator]XP_011143794.1 protein bangles and beads [Harpegnathos saltator]XP_011143796.1 protein bangles and beads [Harpegnathos saltator]EFN81725.1 hypothetical protein EAI_13468 [Harpegnathos saltator]